MYEFKDHFSKQSNLYAKHRPTYPEELFKYLASISNDNKLAWDCATGNGQAAVKLSRYFEKVIATDASKAQISNSEKRDNIVYLVSKAEETEIETNSIDLITVAQAIHWFNVENFYTEAERVLKKKGVLSVWTYDLFSINSDIDKVIKNFYYNIVYEYWPPGRRHIENKYRNIAFPFKKIEPPKFTIELLWNRNNLINYLNTWSSVQNYKDKNNSNPIDIILDDLKSVWNNGEQMKKITWDITLLIGYK